MATTTPNYNLTKPAGTDTVDIGVINTNMDLIDTAVAAKETPTGAQTKATTAETNAKAYADTQDANHLKDYVRQPGYAVDIGTANHLIVTLSPAPTSYLDGMGLAVKVKVAGTAATDINVNGLGVKAIYDAFGNAVTNFRANTTYSMKYESISGNFILQGKGGGGNATAPQLLLGATATADTGPIVGTMPNNGAVTITPSATLQIIPAGYHNGSGSVPAVVVPAANVLAGTTIAGTAGTMSNNGTVSITPSASPQGIGAGYHNGLGTVAAVTVPPANVLTGTTIAGTAGTMPNRGAVAITPSTVTQTIIAGYHNGSGSVAGDADLIAANIKNGINLFNVIGTAPIPSGTAVAANVLTGTTFSNTSSVGLSGSMANNGTVGITPSTSTQTIAAGYHSGSGTVAGASTLVAANILSGVNIFGVVGTSIAGKRTATGTVTSSSALQGFYTGGGVTGVNKYGVTISGLAFTTGLVLLVDCTTSSTVSMTIHLNKTIKNMSYGSSVDAVNFQYNDSGSSTYTITSFYSTVDGTSITLPVVFANKSYWWIAYEY